ncbi:capsule biosynthesis protein [Paracoccus aerodenitrificans]|uniref:capsule biosynthesis protein n=1 Tax=Paracoccus aerodenitrificans TaxID=3017781 RepID=UPI0022F12A73|nr:capsule biosynthesis protein [Paracoccus aerodenitrificans]WBU63234.1 capsule biosynthesis protein [Paracoccus aerodenitrificans]
MATATAPQNATDRSSPAGLILRGWILLSFLLFVIAPSGVWGWYLWRYAQPQYVSTIAFSVRKEETNPTLDLLGGLTELTSSTSAKDPDILYDFLRSQDIVATIDDRLDLGTIYSRGRHTDPVFTYDPDGTLEQLTRYWRRQVRVDYDSTTRLITLRVMAFIPEDAVAIAEAAFEESSRTINRLSDIARDDATRFAQQELSKAQRRLTEARQKLTAFRIRTQIVDPAADLEGQMEVLNALQGQLVEAIVALETLRETAREGDARMIQGQRRINAIRAQISAERQKFGTPGNGPNGESYATLVAEYESLAADVEFAETDYRTAHASYETALAQGQRQSRYLAAHIKPRLAESPQLPNRPVLLAKMTLALLLCWSILLLCYYSICERR